MIEKEEIQYQIRILQQEMLKLDAIMEYCRLRYPLAQKELIDLSQRLNKIGDKEDGVPIQE